MNWTNILTVYLKELKDSLRDRRTLLSTIIIPTLVMPLLTFGVGKVASGVIGKARSETPTVMILGGEDSPGVVARLKESKKIKVVPTSLDWKEDITEKKVRAAVQLPEKFEAGLTAGAAPTVVIYHYEGEMKSSFGAGELEKFFRELREQTTTARLAERSLPATLAKPFDFKRENVAPPEKVGGNLFGGVVPYLIIILCFTGAMYPAMDLTAGEKERGTMETLLCSPVARVDIVLGKFLMVLTGSLSALYGVWGTAANDVWAVGQGGTILHWDGARWSTIPSGTTETLRSIWGSSPTDIWAVGERGTAVHYTL